MIGNKINKLKVFCQLIEKEENLEISIGWLCMLQITVSLTWRAECT